MVGHLDVDVVRRDQGLFGPPFLDDLHQFGGNVDAPTVLPPIFEPLSELRAGIVVEYVHVEFALAGQARQRQVTATQVADDGIDGVRSKEQVKLGVKRMTKEQL